MNIKNFILGGIVGGIVDFLLGWVFYGMVFSSFYPTGEDMDITFIGLGCLSMGFLLSYIFNKWTSISTFMGGVTAGATIGIFMSLGMAFFEAAASGFDPKMLGIELIIGICIYGAVGGVIGAIRGALKD